MLISNIIGVFGTKNIDFRSKMRQILKSLPAEEVVRERIDGLNDCFIEMKNGQRYMGLSATKYAIGYRWYQVYVPYDIDLDFLRDVIKFKIVSDLPKHLQIIGYWT